MTEQGLLKTLQNISRRTGAKLIGDDAAVLRDLVISTDQFVQDVHFRWSWQSPKEVGYKGVVQALSDMAAMATAPAGLLLSAALPVAQESFWSEVFSGVEKACLEYQVPLLGGDLTRSYAITYLDFVVLGFNPKPLLKKGATPGDLLAVSGPLGAAKAGLMCFENEWSSHVLQKAFLKPRAQINIALNLHQQQALTALTDISDSLSRSVYDLSVHSSCGFEIDLAKIPFLPELKLFCTEKNLDLKSLLLSGGEDYQLLMTLPANSSEKLISDHGLSVIGRATNSSQNFYTQDGKKTAMTEVGWDPFDL